MPFRPAHRWLREHVRVVCTESGFKKASGRVAPDDAPPRDHFIASRPVCGGPRRSADRHEDGREVEIAQAIGSKEFDLRLLLTQFKRCGADKLATDRLLQRVRYLKAVDGNQTCSTPSSRIRRC